MFVQFNLTSSNPDKDSINKVVYYETHFLLPLSISITDSICMAKNLLI